MALLKFMNLYLIILTLIAIFSIVRFYTFNMFGRWVAGIVIFGAICEYGHFTMGYYFRNSMPVAHLGLIVSTAIYTKVYYDTFHNKKWARLIGILGIVAIIVLLINSLFINDIKSWPVNSIMAANFLIVFFALAQFTEMLRYPGEDGLEKQALFWFNTANLIFYSSSHIYLVLYQYSSQTGLLQNWMIHLVEFLGIIYYIGYFIVLRLSTIPQRIESALQHG